MDSAEEDISQDEEETIREGKKDIWLKNDPLLTESRDSLSYCKLNCEKCPHLVKIVKGYRAVHQLDPLQVRDSLALGETCCDFAVYV